MYTLTIYYTNKHFTKQVTSIAECDDILQNAKDKEREYGKLLSIDITYN